MTKRNLWIVVAMLFVSCSNIRPSRLTCEYQTSPLIDVQAPRLSWKNNSCREGVGQTAYQIRVMKHSAGEEVVVWDSGKVESENSLYIRYAGEPLCSSCDYSWQVRVWDKQGRASRWSKRAKWHTGKLSSEEWQAKWVGVPWQDDDSYDVEWARSAKKPSRPKLKKERINDVVPAPLLRKEFEVTKAVRSARFYGTGLGYFELYLNGERVGDDYLSPNQTNYDRRPLLGTRGIAVEDPFEEYLVAYVGHDLTSYIKRGQNCVGAILGNGFYDLVEYWPPMGYGTPRMFGQIEIEYVDGTRDVVATDTSWRCAKSAIVADQMFLGEHYDARLEHEGWATADYDDSEWSAVVEKRAPCGKLVAQNGPADKIVRRYKPTSIKKQEDGSLLVTFPEEISGWVALENLRLDKGQKVDIKYICESLNGANSYTAKGVGLESYHARFVWFVFSQVEIRGVENLTSRQIEAHAVNSDVATVAEFESSNVLLDALVRAWRLTQLDNMHGGVASDCPQRERSPYTGDGQLACQMVMHNFDATAFYNKWLRDMRGAQTEDGYVPNSAPWQPGCGGGPAWGAAIAIIPWEFYQYYGDKQVLEEYYVPTKRYIEWMNRWVDDDGVMEAKEEQKWKNLCDWIMPYGEFPDAAAMHTFAYFCCVDIAEKMATELGYDDEAKLYASLRERTIRAFHNRFYNAEERSYGKHGANVVALRMGMPDGYQKEAVEALKRELAEADNHIITGIIGTRYLFDALCENGEVDLVYTIINRRSVPSFGYWIEQGSTTLWESWEGRKGLSKNHPMWGGAMTWFYRFLAGVKSLQAGFRTFEVAPMVPQGLDYIHYRFDTVYGELEVEWRIENGVFSLDCIVPVGAEAVVRLPYGDGKSHKVGAGHHKFKTEI